MVYRVIAEVEGHKVSGNELQQKWAPWDIPGPKTLAGYSLFMLVDASFSVGSGQLPPYGPSNCGDRP